MIKKIFFLVLCSLWIIVNAQVQNNFSPYPTYIQPRPEFISFNKTEKFINNESTLNFLKINFLNQSIGNQSLVLEKSMRSPAGLHLRFKHYFKNFPVYQSYVQAHYSNEGNLYYIVNALANFDLFTETKLPLNKQFWVNTSIGLVPSYLTTKYDSLTNNSITNIYSINNQLLESYNNRLYLHSPDTLVTAMVYLPNPIVAANATYGGMYRDNNDQNNIELKNARFPVRVPLKYENGKFILTDGLLSIKNLHDPAIDPIQPTDTFINCTRDSSGFEDINAFYHLKTYSDYIRKAGFSNLLDSIYVDTHGANGSDDSFFDPGQYPYEIEYGTGNVDDGEDGQVVIHEFGHSLSVIAAPSTVKGSQRIAMEEGQADYIAMSYSNYLSKNKPTSVFSWDGHNEFWSGFVVNSPRKYKDTSRIKDIDREIWSTPLMCIYNKLGRSKTDSLILSSYFHQVAYGQMHQMARVILKMDSVLFNGKNAAKIWQCFTDQGILDTVPWYLIKIDKILNSSEINIYNTSDFSTGIAPVRIIFDNPYLWDELKIYNNLGQILSSTKIEKEIILNPELFIPQVYYLKINSRDGKFTYTKKIIRF